MSGRTRPTRKPLATFEPFTTISVPFPYIERLAGKRRPALVVSTPRLARNHGLIWVLMITSAANPSSPGDIPIDDLKRAGLPKPSVVRPTKITTLETTHALPIGDRYGGGGPGSSDPAVPTTGSRASLRVTGERLPPAALGSPRSSGRPGDLLKRTAGFSVIHGSASDLTDKYPTYCQSGPDA
jgi:mRNA interferase MazF